MRKNKWKQQTFVLLALLAMSVQPAWAAPISQKTVPKPDSTVLVYGQGKPLFNLNFYNQGNGLASEPPSTYTLNSELQQAIVSGTQYWADLLAPVAQNAQALDVWIMTMDDANAMATSRPGNCLQQMLLTGKLQNEAGGIITIGKNFGVVDPNLPEQHGWGIYPTTQLPQNGLQADLVGTVRHEMGHALGIVASNAEKDAEGYFHFADQADFNSYTAHLYDQNGHQAQAGGRIVSDITQARPGDFVVEPTGSYMSSTGETIITGGKMYFTGEQVADVLQGTLLGKDQVPGIPVNAWEDGNPEFSHFQIGALMSHETYANYTTFTEVELAAMQDMGYLFDRRNVYGASVYNSGLNYVNNNGYTARNASGTLYLPGVYNTTAFGVGLHIYGGQNTITQAADILTAGTAAIGIRVDGQENKLTIGQGVKVYANGAQGTGLLVSAGRNQQINQLGDLRALGENGIGARFDYGSSSNGADDEYHGSYINYQYDKDDSTKSDNIEVPTSLQGPLVETFNVAGTLAGQEAAIAIGANAYVQNINILNGAVLQGDIISKWQEFDPVFYPNLVVQHSNPAELVTNLNFAANNIVYAGNITGKQNMRIQVVKDGDLYYTGTAKVLSTEVANGAILRGNASYELDGGNGVFTNHGLVAPALVDGKTGILTIQGDFTSDGKLGLVANLDQASKLQVSGKADVTGSQLVRQDGSLYLPDVSYEFLAAEQLTGVISGGDFTGMLDAQVETGVAQAGGSSASVAATLKRANNLGAMDAVQSNTYQAMEAMYDATQHKTELAGLYSLATPQAKQALTDIAGGFQAEVAAYTQSERTIDRAVAGRLGHLASKDQPKNEYDLWGNLGKSWTTRDHLAWSSHSSQLVFGADRPWGEHWRQGFIFAYGDNSLAMDNASGTNKDYRLGVYGGFQQKANNFYTYFTFGRQTTDATRYLRALDLRATSEYDSRTLELGAEYKYNLQYGRGKTWQVSPYVNAQVVRYLQDDYRESGAGVYDQIVQSAANTYTAGEIGLELARSLGRDGYAVRCGYRRIFSGAEPEFTMSYAGNSQQRLALPGEGLSCNHFVCEISGAHEFAAGWKLSGAFAWERSSSDKKMQAALEIRREW
ncbi:MAG: autotransporter domain-containing protein [Acidaminococcaceae bacterium]